jgi:hypothetical protein
MEVEDPSDLDFNLESDNEPTREELEEQQRLVTELEQVLAAPNANDPAAGQPPNQNSGPVLDPSAPGPSNRAATYAHMVADGANAYDPKWFDRTNSSIAIKSKFKGVHDTQKDVAAEAHRYKVEVGNTISMCRVPDTEWNYVAFNLLEDEVKNAALAYAVNTLKHPLAANNYPQYEDILAYVDSISLRAGMGPLSTAEQSFNFSMEECAKHEYNKTGIIPDITVVNHYLQKEFAKSDLCNVSKCVAIQKALRSMPEIRKAVRFTNVGAQKVELVDPDQMFQALLTQNKEFKDHMQRVIRSGSSASAKRPFSPSVGPSGHQSKSQSQTYKAGSASQSKGKRVAWSPFVALGNQVKPYKPKDADWVPWIQGQNKLIRDQLSSQRKCWLCQQQGHSVLECPQSKAKFAAKSFCWHPRNR